ncbi:MAG: glycerol-3-phosphate dehydrogenase [Gammaproteobacteria bacterium]|nr:glycerol-3-phosphate dehydrogenase [Gammaproteobacteria bacterium]
MARDLLIVGGGIHGAGIARDAAGRGLSVLLVEKDSLAAHTSSASSKLVHGGLRYLEYLKLRLVRESLSERESLLAIAPHLVQRQRFVLPYRGRLRPAWAVRLGLFLYDRLGRNSSLEGSTRIRFADSPYGEPLQRRLRSGFVYSDCTADDSRLVILNAKDAAERGAEVRVRHRLLRASRQGSEWRAEIRDEATGETAVEHARALVNAAGPWVAEVIGGCQAGGKKSVRLVKGSHIVVPRLYEGTQAYALQHSDRRLVFVIPWQEDFTLIGTTDVPWQGAPGRCEIEPAEVDYLCEVVNRNFEHRISPADVAWSFAGIRALQDDDSTRASAVTREFELALDAGAGRAPLLSVVGGKLTTYRRLADLALGKLAPWLGTLPGEWTATAPLPGGDLPGGDVETFAQELARRWPFVGERRCRRLTRAYGTRAIGLLEPVRAAADLGEDFGGGMTRLEVDYLVCEEWARTAHDIHWLHSKTGLRATAEDRRRLDDYLADPVAPSA